MTPLDFPLLADANISPAVVQALRAAGLDVATTRERGFTSATDAVILAAAHAEGRAVVTHDGDFGALAVHQGRPFTGLIYLRPGHIRPEKVLEFFEALRRAPVDVTAPFIVVAERRGDVIRVRLRHHLSAP